MRYLELSLLYILLPLALSTIGGSRWVWILPVWALSVMTWQWLHHARKIRFSEEWAWHRVRGKPLRTVLLRFAICAAAMMLCMAWWMPENLFSFPRERPQLWLVVMLLYPVLSAFPQEIVFRSFFFARYGSLFRSRHAAVVLNAVLFGYAHIVMHNPFAVVMSAAGGLLFADTYRRHRALALVCLEHALYGCFVFTLGLGRYFFRRAV